MTAGGKKSRVKSRRGARKGLGKSKRAAKSARSKTVAVKVKGRTLWFSYSDLVKLDRRVVRAFRNFRRWPTYEEIGCRDDLSDAVYRIDPTDTPFAVRVAS